MFQGDHPAVGQVMRRACRLAHELGHPRVGSEHLLLALTEGPLSGLGGIEQAVCRAAPDGAGVAADREALAALGVDLGTLPGALADRPPAKEPLFPLGVGKARRRCARAVPPVGLDVQAVYAASLRLALARRERRHRVEHLALALVALDPGAEWVMRTTGVDRGELLSRLAAAFPPPRRNRLLRAERRVGRRSRCGDIVRRYQHTTGRTAVAPSALAALVH
ncbi:Clp amino terminal domain-containing protein, pathogenicity island component [Amycolatopsis tolypomycina]|uniref:Clp amino terminal domain-containing protein, pathogenicity island component n=1 Tax=Amycolatopsis tolypomycina TaxID=208445 RepID=A0A1H4YK47_9PSEU|nr:Clp protease N-terminal domain-containing protein [Amycolatopsis tolypomycina]SED17544.1 Clp amino terminal domain-containing protein, pathogenicity island component [Amycolatopsis tolypomycina]